MKPTTCLALILPVILILTTCGAKNPLAPSTSSTNSSSSSTAQKFHPPSWLYGTWAADVNTYGVFNYIFTSTNVTSAVGATTQYNFGQLYATVPITESIGTTNYEWSFTSGGDTSRYTFYKVNSTTIHHYLTSVGMTTGPTPMIKN